MGKAIAFRLDPNSEPGKIWQKYIESGYQARQIVEELLLKVGEQAPPPHDQISQITLFQMQQLVSKLEDVVDRVQAGGVMVTRQHIQDAVNAFTDDFQANMDESFERGFTMEDLASDG